MGEARGTHDVYSFKIKIGVSCLQIRNDFFLRQSGKFFLADSIFFEKLWTMTVSIKSPHHTLAFGEVLSDDLRILYILTLWRYTHPGIWKVDTSSEKQMDSMKWGSFPSFRALSWQTFRAVRCLLQVKGTHFAITYTFLFLLSFDNYLSWYI